MNERWQSVIDIVSTVKLECINVDKIISMLNYDRTVDEQVIDSLYIAGILTIREYKQRMLERVKYLEEKTKYVKERIKEAESKENEFNPMIFYALSGQYKGNVIETALNNLEND